MKKRIYFPLLLIGMICCIVFCSCSKDDEVEDVSYGDKMKVSPYMIQIPKANRAGIKVTLTSPSNWTSECDAGVVCRPSSGTPGKTTITVNRTGVTSKKNVMIFFKDNHGGGTALSVELLN